MESNKVLRKKSATVFPSELELIEDLTEKMQFKALLMLFNYELYGIEPKPEFLKNKTIKALWITSKPLIDKRVRNYENGLKGGAPKGSKNAGSKGKTKPNNNRTVTEAEPTHNRTVTETKPDKDKEKEKDKDKETSPYSVRGSLKAPLTSPEEMSELDKKYPEQVQGDWDGDWSKIPDDEE